MIEEGIPEKIAFRIHAGLLAEACGTKERKPLKCTKCSLTFGDCHCGACHWKKENRDKMVIMTFCS